MSHAVVKQQTSCLAVSPSSIINYLHDLGKGLKHPSYKTQNLD